jgi:hypothetical protein
MMHVVYVGEMRNAYRILAGKNLKDRDHLVDVNTSGRVGNIPIFLKEVGCMNVNWIHLV